MMTVGEFKAWAESSNVTDDAELIFDRGIDLLENVSNAVYSNGAVILYPEGFEQILKEDSDESITA